MSKPSIARLSQEHIEEHTENIAEQREPTNQNENNMLIYIVCCSIGTGGFMFGYDTGTIAGYINMTSFMENFGQRNEDKHLAFLSRERAGIIVSSFSLGACVGGVFGGVIGDKYGRKLGIITAAVTYIVAAIIQITAKTEWYQILSSRIICGLAVGALTVLIPMFQAEVSPPHLRGSLVSSFQLMVTLGIATGYLVCFICSKISGQSSYRTPMSLCFLWAIFLIVAIIVIPESPRHLVSQGKEKEAAKSLSFFYRKDSQDAIIKKSIASIQASLQQEKNARSTHWRELWCRQLITGILIQAFQQLCGANYFFYYGTTLFRSVGLDNSFATSIIFGILNFLATFGGLYNVERFGRRKCLLVGSFTMMIFFVIYSYLGSQLLVVVRENEKHIKRPKVGSAMIAVTCLYLCSFAMTWAPIAFVVCSEIFPLRIKSKGMAIAIGSNWITNFLISFFTPFITDAIGYYYGFVFSACLLMSMVFVYFMIPETKGLSLEKIDEIFKNIG